MVDSKRQVNGSDISCVDLIEPPPLSDPSPMRQASASVSPSSPQIKGILNTTPVLGSRNVSSGSESGLKTTLKALFLPPPTPGRQLKVKYGQTLGKSYQRTQPLPNNGIGFQGAEVLPYDPRGQKASAGDGIIPPGCLETPPHLVGQQQCRIVTDSLDVGDRESSTDNDNDNDSETDDVSDLSRSIISETSSGVVSPTYSRTQNSLSPHPSRGRQDSLASTMSSSSSNCAIRFAPLPLSGRLKRANSITIGIAARNQLLLSQGSGAAPRPYQMPPQLQNSQQWFDDGNLPEDVIDIGEEIRKGAIKAWKKIRGPNANPAAKLEKESPLKQVEPVNVAVTEKLPTKAVITQNTETGNHVSPSVTTARKVDGLNSVTPNRAKVGDDKNNPEQETPKLFETVFSQFEQMVVQEEEQGENVVEAIEEEEQPNTTTTTTDNSAKPDNHHPDEPSEGPQYESYDLSDDSVDQANEDGTKTPTHVD